MNNSDHPPASKDGAAKQTDSDLCVDKTPVATPVKTPKRSKWRFGQTEDDLKTAASPTARSPVKKKHEQGASEKNMKRTAAVNNDVTKDDMLKTAYTQVSQSHVKTPNEFISVEEKSWKGVAHSPARGVYRSPTKSVLKKYEPTPTNENATSSTKFEPTPSILPPPPPPLSRYDGVTSKADDKKAMDKSMMPTEMVSDGLILVEQSARRIKKVAHTPVEKLDDMQRVLRNVWEDLEKQEWYHGMIPIEDAKSILQHEGDFLVRKSENEIKSNPPILTVMWNQILHHLPLYAVQRTRTSLPEFTINMILYCNNYTSLVKKHWSNKIPVFRDIILITAAAKQSWELDKKDVIMEKKIGEGQFGEVWRGKLRTEMNKQVTNLVVAVKIMKVTANTQQQLEMFHQEARLMRMYDHRNVVKLHGIIFSEDDVMVVMEFVSGGGLDSYLKNKKLSPLVKASFCYDIAAGLAYLHSKNCMHRDVAARNCLVTWDGRMVKLSDFGLAAHGRRIKLSSTEKVPVRWQAPEVLFYRIYMRESDVWSFGMTMSEIYNDGKVPFHDKTIAEIRLRIHDPRFRPIIPHFTCYFEIPALMQKCWEVDVTKRPTMVDAVKVLKGYCIHTVKEKVLVQDTKQKFIDRVKAQSCMEQVTVGSRMIHGRPAMQQVITSTTSAVSATQRITATSREISYNIGTPSRDRVLEEYDLSRIVPGQRLKPFVPAPVEEKDTQHKRSSATPDQKHIDSHPVTSAKRGSQSHRKQGKRGSREQRL